MSSSVQPAPVPPRLPPAPETVGDAQGQPAFGTYQGALARVDLASLAEPWKMTPSRALLQRKRWHYTLVATPEVLCVLAVVDVGYSATGFISAVDLKDRRILFDGGWMLPPGPMVEVGDAPAEGLRVRVRQPGLSASVEREQGEGRYRVRAQVSRLRMPLQGQFNLEAQLIAANAGPPLTVVAPTAADRVNVTMKAGALLAFGRLEARGRTYQLDGGVGGTDYTHGLLPRHTVWRWAFACGRLPDGTPLSLNLVEGFNDAAESANECALWIGNQLIPLPRASIRYNPHDVLDPWAVSTPDGSIDLTFKPLHAHRESRELGLVSSRFVQPLGLFRGTVRAAGRTWTLKDIPGVTENQDVRW